MATVIRETVGAIKEMNKLDWNPAVGASSPAANHSTPLLAKNAGTSAEGLYAVNGYPDPTATDLPQVKDWVKRYTKMFGKPPMMYVIGDTITLIFLR